MAVLEGLEPKKVFENFEAISKIPHGSGNTKALSDWMVDFAKERGLECVQDELNNIIMIKEASPGYEDKEPVIFQGHMDMVCNKEDGCTLDMEKEGLQLVVEGDKLSAKGTTLGADNGIAVAYMLAMMDDDTLKHPRIEAVFTVDEETTLGGAEAIDVAPLKGKKFINLDSEDEGLAIVSCAGGAMVRATLPISREPAEGDAYKVSVSGMIGGHSGLSITKGQANALKTLGRLLYELHKTAGAGIVSIEGGVADNVIPVSASAVFVSTQGTKVKELCDQYREIFKHEFKVDPDFKLALEPAEAEMDPLDQDSARRVLACQYASPNGVLKMTHGIDGLPQTSLSLGVVRTEQNQTIMEFGVRSALGSECLMVAETLGCMAEALGGSVELIGLYPGWEFQEVSPLRDLVCSVYKDQTGHEMQVEALHCGLECGFFAEKIPGLDCVSIGPDIADVHTPDESISIGSVARTWELIREVLERM